MVSTGTPMDPVCSQVGGAQVASPKGVVAVTVAHDPTCKESPTGSTQTSTPGMPPST